MTAQDKVDKLVIRGLNALDQGTPAEAIDPLREAAQLGSTSALYALGNALWQVGDLDAAASTLTEAAEQGETDAWLNLGLVRLAAEQPHLAVEALRQALDVGDNNAWAPLGTALLEAGDRGGSRLAFAQAAENGDPEGMMQLAWTEWEDGNSQLAIELAREAQAHGQADAAAVRATWRWETTGNPSLEADLRSASSYPPARVGLAKLLVQSGRVDDAVAVLSAAVQENDVIACVPLGNIYLDELGDAHSAEQAYRRGVELEDLFALTNLGLLLRQEGRTEEALPLLIEAASRGDERAQKAITENGRH